MSIRLLGMRPGRMCLHDPVVADHICCNMRHTLPMDAQICVIQATLNLKGHPSTTTGEPPLGTHSPATLELACRSCTRSPRRRWRVLSV